MTKKRKVQANMWRKTVSEQDAYHVVIQGTWSWYVLKANKDLTKPFASAFCVVRSPMTGPAGDMGDCYAADVPGLLEAYVKAHRSPEGDVSRAQTRRAERQGRGRCDFCRWDTVGTCPICGSGPRQGSAS